MSYPCFYCIILTVQCQIFIASHLIVLNVPKTMLFSNFKYAIQLPYKYSEVSLFSLFQLFSAKAKFEKCLHTMDVQIRSDFLHGRKDTQFVKSVWSISHSKLKTDILPLLVRNNKARTNTHTHTHIFKFSVQEISSLKKVLTKTFPIFFWELYVKLFYEGFVVKIRPKFWQKCS